MTDSLKTSAKANAIIAAMKWGMYFATFSTAMLTEAIHSTSDLGNQLFLWIGKIFSKKEGQERFAFGSGKAEKINLENVDLICNWDLDFYKNNSVSYQIKQSGKRLDDPAVVEMLKTKYL